MGTWFLRSRLLAAALVLRVAAALTRGERRQGLRGLADGLDDLREAAR